MSFRYLTATFPLLMFSIVVDAEQFFQELNWDGQVFEVEAEDVIRISPRPYEAVNSEMIVFKKIRLNTQEESSLHISLFNNDIVKSQWRDTHGDRDPNIHARLCGDLTDNEFDAYYVAYPADEVGGRPIETSAGSRPFSLIWGPRMAYFSSAQGCPPWELKVEDYPRYIFHIENLVCIKSKGNESLKTVQDAKNYERECSTN